MELMPRNPGTTHRFPIGRMAALAVAVGGLSTSALVVGSAGAMTARAGASNTVVVSTAHNSKVGTFLVSGKTLYTLNKGNAACNSACVAIWPQLVLPKGVTKATAGTGVNASKLGTVKRSGGVLQVTYGGKALYWFAGDSGPGKVTGNNLTDTWGKWSAVVTAKAASSSSSSSSSSGSGSGSGSTSSGSGGAGF
jgi:predicted lipoprotein with Yx(FWY)xxD motif